MPEQQRRAEYFERQYVSVNRFRMNVFTPILTPLAPNGQANPTESPYEGIARCVGAAEARVRRTVVLARRRPLPVWMLLFAVGVTGSWMLGVPATAEPLQSSVHGPRAEAEPRSVEYAAVVRAPYSGDYSLRITAETPVGSGSIPRGCTFGSQLVEQVLNTEDQAPEGIPPLTRSMLICRIGPLEAGEVHTVVVPVSEAAVEDGAVGAYLHEQYTAVGQVELSKSPATACAPPGRAPTWTSDSGRTDAAGTERVVTVVGRANGQLAGVARPGSRMWLTGVDACEQRIERSMITTDEGRFRFAGLMPGHYALHDESGTVVHRVELSAATPVVEGLDLAPTETRQQ